MNENLIVILLPFIYINKAIHNIYYINSSLLKFSSLICNLMQQKKNSKLTPL